MTLFQSVLLDDKVIPEVDKTPVSPSEKLVREEIKKLNENSEELKKLKEQIEQKKEGEKHSEGNQGGKN